MQTSAVAAPWPSQPGLAAMCMPAAPNFPLSMYGVPPPPPPPAFPSWPPPVPALVAAAQPYHSAPVPQPPYGMPEAHPMACGAPSYGWAADGFGVMQPNFSHFDHGAQMMMMQQQQQQQQQQLHHHQLHPFPPPYQHQQILSREDPGFFHHEDPHFHAPALPPSAARPAEMTVVSQGWKAPPPPQQHQPPQPPQPQPQPPPQPKPSAPGPAASAASSATSISSASSHRSSISSMVSVSTFGGSVLARKRGPPSGPRKVRKNEEGPEDEAEFDGLQASAHSRFDRQRINAKERDRRNSIKSGFDRLQDSLPADLAAGANNKNQVMLAAIKYIKILTNEDVMLQRRIKQLRTQNAFLATSLKRSSITPIYPAEMFAVSSTTSSNHGEEE